MRLYFVLFVLFAVGIARPRAKPDIIVKIEGLSEPEDLRSLWETVEDNNKSKVFIDCCIKGYMDAARKILLVDPEITKKEDSRCLRSAANQGKDEIVKLLVHEHGLDPNVWASGGGHCALVIAAQKGHQKVVDVLMLSNVDENLESAFKCAYASNQMSTAASILADPRMAVIDPPMEHSLLCILNKCKAGICLECEDKIESLQTDEMFVLMKCAGAYGHVKNLSKLLSLHETNETQFEYLLDYSMYFQQKDSVCVIAKQFTDGLKDTLKEDTNFDQFFSALKDINKSIPKLKRILALNMQMKFTVENQATMNIPAEIMSIIFWYQLDNWHDY